MKIEITLRFLPFLVTLKLLGQPDQATLKPSFTQIEPSFLELLLPSVLCREGLNSAELRPVANMATGKMAEPLIIPEGLVSSSVVHGLTNSVIFFASSFTSKVYT